MLILSKPFSQELFVDNLILFNQPMQQGLELEVLTPR